MTDDEILQVVQAHKDGKQIQYRRWDDSDNVWRDSNQPLWNFRDMDYRVKPENLSLKEKKHEGMDS